ncbi:hypothetical protein D0Y65_033618 [Glycine soja]|uniref:Uncharacterized protein n=1 Tax=Glycine soja TaxID=3848 RepID=A0A445HLU7_GLYSO|nr:hypothetical protein D0Y65_033618 [Glycine soja]
MALEGFGKDKMSSLDIACFGASMPHVDLDGKQGMESIEEEQEEVAINASNETILNVVNEATYVFRENDDVSGEEDNGVEDENEDVFEDDGDILQFENLRKAGIRAPQIFGFFANISDGYEKIGFYKIDLHNNIT